VNFVTDTKIRSDTQFPRVRAHGRRRTKQFGGWEESARMFKTKYFQMYSVFSKKIFTKIFLIGLVWSLKIRSSFSGLPEYFQICPDMFQIFPDMHEPDRFWRHYGCNIKLIPRKFIVTSQSILFTHSIIATPQTFVLHICHSYNKLHNVFNRPGSKSSQAVRMEASYEWVNII